LIDLEFENRGIVALKTSRSPGHNPGTLCFQYFPPFKNDIRSSDWA